MNRKLVIVATLLALVASIQAPIAQAAEGDTAENVVVTSLAADQIDVAITVFKPAAASAENQVPVIFESHGWGGSRSTAIGGAVEDLLNCRLRRRQHRPARSR